MVTIGRDEKSSWRIFIAVPIPKEIQNNIQVWCQKNREVLLFHRWTYTEDYHITVQFLGDTSVGRLNSLQEELEKTVSKVESFQLEVQGIGTFGKVAEPRVLWAGVHGDVALLKKLHGNVIKVTSSLGFIAEDRPYHPHVTLARKYKEDQKFNPECCHTPISFGSWSVDRIVIYRTNLGNAPMYEEIASISLQS